MPEDDVLERVAKVLARKKLLEEYSKAILCVRETFTELGKISMSGQDYIKSFSSLLVVLGQTADRMIYFLGKPLEEVPLIQFDGELKRMVDLNGILDAAKKKLK